MRNPVQPKKRPIPRPTYKNNYMNERIESFMNPESKSRVYDTHAVGFVHYQEERLDLYHVADGSSDAWTWAKRVR